MCIYMCLHPCNDDVYMYTVLIYTMAKRYIIHVLCAELRSLYNTPSRDLACIRYTHDARGYVAPEGEGVYTSQITKKGCYK